MDASLFDNILFEIFKHKDFPMQPLWRLGDIQQGFVGLNNLIQVDPNRHKT